MSKTKKYQNFREFYEDEDSPSKKTKMKPMNESKKDKDRFRKQYRFIDPRDIQDEDYIDSDEYNENTDLNESK